MRREDEVLRPRSLDEFIGQKTVVAHLRVYVQAARMRNEPLDHVLLYGPPGLGKTTLAHVIAREMGQNIRCLSGPAFARPGDLAAVLTTVAPKDVVFIDEIHRLPKQCEEILYGAMEDFTLHVLVGKGPFARDVSVHLPPFTLIGATTRVSLLSAPLRNRFGIIERLDFYADEEITLIVMRAAQLLGIAIDPEAAQAIACRSRGTPRIAHRLLRRVRDFAEVLGRQCITRDTVERTFEELEVDGFGLTKVDRKFLKVLFEEYAGGPVGIESLAMVLGEDPDTLEEVYEPFLVKMGFIARTKRGRILTPSGREYINQVVLREG
ncbi:Holliday junction branch migration DNA helicase RuvB [Candidatus Caldatribacterium sp.]|uniref:Holliday junction branch migration DNA helicase RuvB n=1 Tax=Candidatus Caldatribacterium sp. TaxID=2282143 RepID=UPI00299A645D|nr:Holliday junction branch migration DNA helicase RuvB [Candidatus Caldatribacterium sp.]MDW8081552.1 Holliday junction branch migration DNA helicase RuvB [Candidatus Calescibacterium sp.]